MAQIVTEGPVYRTTETAGVVSTPVRAYSRYGSRSSMLMFLVLLLLLAWMYATRGLGSLGFGVNREPAQVTWPPTSTTTTIPPAVEPTIAVTTETVPVPLPATPPVIATAAPVTTVPVEVRVSERTTPVQLPGTVAMSSDFIGTARVSGDAVNMRTGPGEKYRATVVLPRGWEVYIMRQSHRDNYGEVWIETSVSTDQGVQKGWINNRYLATIR